MNKVPLANELLSPPAKSIDHFSSLWLPSGTRTPDYDRRALNGGANRRAPYSPEAHAETPRWQYNKELGERLLSRLIQGRFAITEGAIRNSGGDIGRDNNDIQQEALGHLVDLAVKGVGIRVLLNGTDLTGSAYGDFTLATYAEAEPALLINDGAGRLTRDPKSVGQMTENFAFIWGQGLPQTESIAHLRAAQASYQ